MDKKKISAAIAAVTAYIRTGEEAAARGMMAVPDAAGTTSVEKTAPTGSINLWGLSGRQAIMQNRGLMQMKSFHKTK